MLRWTCWLLRRAHPLPHRDGAGPGIVEGGPCRGVVGLAVAVRVVVLTFSLTLTLAFVAVIRVGEGGGGAARGHGGS
jgi:hypothetical protein